jgi:hypothetical protein
LLKHSNFALFSLSISSDVMGYARGGDKGKVSSRKFYFQLPETSVGGEVQDLCCYPMVGSATFSPWDSMSITRGAGTI